MSYASDILATSGLVNYWRLGEGTGPYADSQGSVTLTLQSGYNTGTSLLTSDPSDACVVKTANNVHDGLISAGNYTFGSTITIEAWIKPASASVFNCGIAGAWTGSGAMLLVGLASNNNLRFYTGGSAIDAATTMTNGSIFHIVGTYDGTNRQIYVNGSSVAGPTAGSSPASTPTKFEIGNYNSSGVDGFRGSIDEVAVYNVALSGATIAAHYTSGTAAAILGRSSAVGFIG